jgi:hypothetical protein
LDAGGFRVGLLSRNGAGRIPAASLLLQEDDVIHVMVAADEIGSLDAAHAGATHGGGH